MKRPNEILWEFTLKCNKNCAYCGSKKLLNSNESKFTHDEITDAIISVNPIEVTITGGEPSTEFLQLEKAILKLKNVGIKVKVLTNGNFFSELAEIESQDEVDEINNAITQYGLSINTLEDIDEFRKSSIYLPYLDKITMITNFGTHNIGNVFDLAKCAAQFSCWQVQLTIGNEFQLDLDAIKDLQQKLTKIGESGLVNVIRADNFVCGKCKAGIHGFSITYDGNIIPCLSYRAWKSDLNIQGTIENIIDIWENGFKFNRERKFVPSCKTISGIEKVISNDDITECLRGKRLNPKPLPSKKLEKPAKPPVVYMYGVVYPKDFGFDNTPVVYGVFQPNDDKNYDNTITVYGVAVPGDKFDNTPMVYGVVEPYNNESITVDNSSSFINKSKSMFDDIIKKAKEKAQEEIDGLKSYLGIDESNNDESNKDKE